MTDAVTACQPDNHSTPDRQGSAYACGDCATPLSDVVTVDMLQRLQNHFSILGQVSVCICTPQGNPLTRQTWGSRFSQLIGTSRVGSAELGAQFKVLADHPRPDEPLRCLKGMTLYAAPINHAGRLLGLIIIGTRSPVWPSPKVIHRIAEKYELDGEDLVAATGELPANIGGTVDAAREFADGLADTIATLYEQGERIRRQLADLRTVYELSQLLSGTLDLQSILDNTVQRVVAVMPIKACGIRLLDESKGELVVQAVCNLSDEYLNKGPVVLRENSIDAAAFAGETVYIEDAPNDPRVRYPENARREGIVSGLCVPMTHRGRTVGVLRVYTAQRYVFSEDETSLLRSIASQAASTIIASRLYDEHLRAERVQRQLTAAGEIQQRMLPDQPPKRDDVSFGCVYAPALQVGGDFYDFIDLPGGETGICIADVVGKGFPAALLMASLRAALRSRAGCEEDLSTLIVDVNRHMCEDTLISEFATLVYGTLSADGKTLRYCNAGHTPPLLLRGDTLTELTAGGTVIGLDPAAEFDTATLDLESQDVLVFITDGVTEAMPFDGSAYGNERLEDSIVRHRELSAEALASAILWDVRRFAGLADQSDDITIVVMKVA